MSDTNLPSGGSTVGRTIVPVAGVNGYRTLREGGGEPHTFRALPQVDAAAQSASATATQAANEGEETLRVAGLVHITDFQVADLASPSRVDFLQWERGEWWRRMLPAYRPQEFLFAHAMESMMRTVRALADSEGERWNLAVSTGDNIDSSQANELAAYLTMLEGGEIDPAFGTRGFADAPVSNGDDFWNPEATDRWQRERHFPHRPGVLAAAAKPIDGQGIGLPWITVFGNHDCLVQGRTRMTPGFDSVLTGSQKPVALAPDAAERTAEQARHAADALDAYVADAQSVPVGQTRAISPTPERRVVSPQEYVQAHLRDPGLPIGHGFTQANATAGTAYYVYDDIPGVRIVGLDTTNPHGHVDGRVDLAQLAWLEGSLREVHSTFIDETGEVVRQSVPDRLVVLASHHGLSTMVNSTGDDSVALAPQVEALLHRFGNVVLWLSGHTHVNRVTPRPGQNGGFWEVSTSSLAEWPVQVRLVELELAVAEARVVLTMVDSAVPVSPTDGLGLADLASLHREVAANDEGSVGGLFAEGAREDRNVLLSIPMEPEAVARIRLAVEESR